MNGQLGADVEPQELLRLAGCYARAALRAQPVTNGNQVNSAPSRLLLIHAIELYLTAYLRHCGVPHGDMLTLNHKLHERALRARENGLPLGDKTLRRLENVDNRQEYKAVRYAPAAYQQSPVNQLESILIDVQRKLEKALSDL